MCRRWVSPLWKMIECTSVGLRTVGTVVKRGNDPSDRWPWSNTMEDVRTPPPKRGIENFVNFPKRIFLYTVGACFGGFLVVRGRGGYRYLLSRKGSTNPSKGMPNRNDYSGSYSTTVSSSSMSQWRVSGTEHKQTRVTVTDGTGVVAGTGVPRFVFLSRSRQ